MQALPDLQGGINIFGRIGCLDENTEIYVEKNNNISKIKIKNLKSEHRVLSYNFKTSKVEYKNATLYDKGEEDVYEITLTSGKKIIVTGDHRFFDINKNEVHVKDLKDGDSLFGRQLVCGNLNPWSRKDVKDKIHDSIGDRRELNKKLAYSMGKKNKGKPEKGINFKTKGVPMSNERKKYLSDVMSGKGNPMYGKITYPKKINNPELKHFVRSKWEEKVCLLLLKYKIDYQYEPETFKLMLANKNVTYTPDLYLPELDLYIEIKGPLFQKQYLKMKEFEKTHNFMIVGNNRYKQIKEFKNINYETFITLTKEEILNGCS